MPEDDRKTRSQAASPEAEADAELAEQLTTRQRIVLASIVHGYIGRGEPIGSRVVSKDLPETLSPATIRNIMADIEELGLIEQPHTSAGRQPTDRGYRIYVDHIMPRDRLEDREIETIETVLREAREDMDLLDAAAAALSRLTNLLGVAISPVLDETRLERVELVPLGERTVLLVASFGSGIIRSVAVEFDAPFTSDQLTALVRHLHLTAIGRSPSEIQRQMAQGEVAVGVASSGPSAAFFPPPDSDIARLAAKILTSLLRLSHSDRSADAYLQGAGNILASPDVASREDLRNIVSLVEDRRAVVQLMQGRIDREGVYITIGGENRDSLLRYLSLVTRGYRLGDARGALGVLGPTRMPYARLVAVVDHIANRLSQESRSAG